MESNKESIGAMSTSMGGRSRLIKQLITILIFEFSNVQRHGGADNAKEAQVGSANWRRAVPLLGLWMYGVFIFVSLFHGPLKAICSRSRM